MSGVEIDKSEILGQIDRICKSPEFQSKQVLCRFLTYIVNETLAGRGEKIKAFSIGVDVFDRDENFDPGQDTLVRINAIRLRRMLDLYYSKTGKHDEILIEIPKGAYKPRFIYKNSLVSKPETTNELDHDKIISLDPTIAVLSFSKLGKDFQYDYFSKGFSYELLVELSNYEDMEVYNYLSVDSHPEYGSKLHSSMIEKGIHFTIGGAVNMDEKRINILVNLHDLFEDRQIWSEKYSEILDAENLIATQENIAQKICAKIGSEYGVVFRKLTEDVNRKKPQDISTYTAILKYFNYLSSRTPESANEAFEALSIAVEKYPHSGMAFASLAALHGTVYSMDLKEAQDSYETFGRLADKAYMLDPNNIFVQIVLSFKYFLYNEKELFLDLSYQILNKNPRSTLRLGSLGFHLALYGEWKTGLKILNSVISRNLEYPLYFHGATCCYHYKNKSYLAALKEANNYKLPHFFWGPLLRAATLGQLNRPEDAFKEIMDLRRLKPDFEEKAHDLISRFVKEESLVLHLLEGLNKAGLKV